MNFTSSGILYEVMNSGPLEVKRIMGMIGQDDLIPGHLFVQSGLLRSILRSGVTNMVLCFVSLILSQFHIRSSLVNVFNYAVNYANLHSKF